MIFNVTASWLLMNATVSLFGLNGTNTSAGYLEYSKSPVQVSSQSALLQRRRLERICLTLGFRAYPLFKLTVRNLPPSSSRYLVDGCDDSCFDIYMECQEFPFQLDQDGNIRVLFKDTASALCAPLTAWDAETLCKRFHQPSENVTIIAGTFDGQMEVWKLHDLCPGWFNFGSNCDPIVPLERRSCDGNYYAAISCQRKGQERYRLKDWGRGGLRGTLEARVDDLWSPVCSHSFSLTDAAVACRTLGYPSSDANYNQRKMRSGRAGGAGEFRCHGDEESLDDCPGVRHHSHCFSYYTVEISCQKAYEGKLRLTGGYDGLLGRLEIFYNNTWGTICAYSFGQAEISTACSQITGGRVRRGRHIFNADVLPLSTVEDILLDDVDCGSRPDLLEDCRHKPIGNHSCTENTIVFLSCSEEPKFRLADRYGPSGRLEVYHDSQWGTICGRRFGVNEARVACKTFNLSSVLVQVSFRGSKDVTSRIWLDDLSCGSEIESLNDCVGWSWGDVDMTCTDQKDVHIFCPSPDRTVTRFSLETSDSAGAGVVRVNHGLDKGDICMATRSQSTAVVACRTLGLPTNRVTLLSASQFRKNIVTDAVMNGIRCRGDETSLLDCPFVSLKSSPCQEADKLVVACGGSLEPDYSLRLVGGSQPNVGRLAVLLYGVWGTVCDTQVTRNVMEVACRKMGLPTSPVKKLDVSKYGRGAGLVWLNFVKCQGNEQGLEFCDKSESGKWCPERDNSFAIQCGKLEVKSNIGAIVGGVVGGLLLLIIIISVVCSVNKGRRNNSPLPPMQRQSQPLTTYGEMRPSREQGFIDPSAPPDYQNISMSTIPVNSVASFHPPASDKTAPPPSYEELFGQTDRDVQEHSM